MKILQIWFSSPNIRLVLLNAIGVTLLPTSIKTLYYSFTGTFGPGDYAVTIGTLLFVILTKALHTINYPNILADYLLANGYLTAPDHTRLLTFWKTGSCPWYHSIPFFLGWFTMVFALGLALLKLFAI